MGRLVGFGRRVGRVGVGVGVVAGDSVVGAVRRAATSASCSENMHMTQGDFMVDDSHVVFVNSEFLTESDKKMKFRSKVGTYDDIVRFEFVRLALSPL
jgi:hypothetical protein